MFIPCHNCFSAKSVSLYCSCIICFLTTHFLTPLLFYVFFRRPSGSSTFSVSDRRTLLWGFHCIRLSFCPKPFCWRLNKVDALSGSRSCRTGFWWILCLCIRLPFRSQEAGCPRLCTKAHTVGRIFFQLVVEKIVHQDFAVVKDRHPGVDRFVQKQLAFCACRSRPGCLKI